MPRGSICVRERCALALAIVVMIAFARGAYGADDAAAGYANVRPSLVKVWAFDAHGRPFESGSGIVIVSNASRSLVLTAAHVVAGASAITVDIDRDRHDIPAHLQERGPRDLALLAVDRGGLVPATFAPRSRAVVEGNLIAVAGFVKHDELIGIVGQEPRLLYPGTISSRPDDGAYLELENVHIEEGLSGGPVFDPDTGDVLGIVTSRTSDQRGGFADSGALVVVPFLASNAIALRERSGRTVVLIAPAPTPTPRPHPAATIAPRPAAKPVVTAPPVVVLAAPKATPDPPAAHVWDARDASPHRIDYTDNGCAIALSLSIADLTFGASTDDARLTLRVARRVASTAACADLADSDPSNGTYRAAAASFDGRHVTVRFQFVAGDNPNAADTTIFPADVSLDANLDAAPVIAHVQLMDADWDDALDVTASRDR